MIKIISVEKLREIQKESEITAEKNLKNHITVHEKNIELILIEAAKQGLSSATVGFPKIIDGYEYSRNEMVKLLKKQFNTFIVTQEYTGMDNYYFSFNWQLKNRKEDV